MVAILDLFSEFDDQDRVLTSEPDEHNEADLREDVVLHRAEPNTVDRAEQTHRDDKNDRERQRPTFVKRREQQENEQNAKRENVNRAVARKFLLERYLRPLGREAGRQDLFSETFNGGKRLAAARAWCRLPAQVGRGKHVVARDLVGAAYLLHGRNRPERNNSAGIISRLQQANVARTQTELGVSLSCNTISAAKEREIVYVCRSEISLQRAEDVAQRHIHAFRFDAIDVEPKLRDVRAKGRQIIRQTGRFICLHHHGESLRLQLVETGVAAILNKQFVTAGITNAGHWRRRKCNHQSFGNLRAHARVYFRQNRWQTLVARFSLGKFFEWKKHGSRVGLIAAEEIESREFDGVENAGGFVCDFRNLVDNRLGPLERSSIR